jgi:UDP-N-acetylglucosamine--N-acetylmuramyl-(pentapeptide) pyrophosphoryl-undecaprenol N-acetylglucosamine transferase
VRILICGGGTAGHIYPGLALARELKLQNSSVEILFVGTSKGLEASIVPESGFAFRKTIARGLRRRVSFDFLVTLGSAVVAFFQSAKIVLEFRPNVVVGLGGYASLPVIAASRVFGVPILIHEQNAVPGLANRICGRMARNVAVSYPGTERFFSPRTRVRLTGNPVREKVCSQSADVGAKTFDLDRSRKTLLVFGGSRGARRINQAMIELYDLRRGRDDLQVLHLTGERDFSETLAGLRAAQTEEDDLLYRIYSYTEDIGAAYAVADLALCRAGATTIAELIACGLPAILVPYPFATDGHQEQNALYVEKAGGAVVVKDSDLSGEKVGELADLLLRNPDRLREMSEAAGKLGKKNAARELAQMVLEPSEQ